MKAKKRFRYQATSSLFKKKKKKKNIKEEKKNKEMKMFMLFFFPQRYNKTARIGNYIFPQNTRWYFFSYIFKI